MAVTGAVTLVRDTKKSCRKTMPWPRRVQLYANKRTVKIRATTASLRCTTSLHTRYRNGITGPGQILAYSSELLAGHSRSVT